MAKVIQRRKQSDDVLQLISLKEIVQIYIQSFVFILYVQCKKFLDIFKNYFDKKLNVTKNIFERQFRVLSVNNNNSKERRAVQCDNQSVCPETFTSQIGVHKYIKIKVS